MSYCVHCGVKLADYESVCPLCGTQVLDPHREACDDAEPLFLDRMETAEKRINTRFLTGLITVILLIPFALTTILDLLFSFGLTWSMYVFGAILCLWAFVVFPISKPGRSPYLYAGINLAATPLFLWLIATFNGGTWFMPLALPLVLLAGVVSMLMIWVLHMKKLSKIAKAGWLIFLLAFLPAGIDVIVTHYLTGSVIPVWAWFVTIPLLALSITALIISRSIALSEWIRRKLFL